MIKTELEMNNLKKGFDVYYIVGRCLTGSRHESQPLSYEDALAEMPKYVGVVDYFGGGIVSLYDWSGEVIRTKVVADFDNLF